MAKKYLAQMNKEELVTYCKENGINVSRELTRRDMIDLIHRRNMDPSYKKPEFRCSACYLGQDGNDANQCIRCGQTLERLRTNDGFVPMTREEEPEPEIPAHVDELKEVTANDMIFHKALRPYISMKGFLRFNLPADKVKEAEKLCKERGFLLPPFYEEWIKTH